MLLISLLKRLDSVGEWTGSIVGDGFAVAIVYIKHPVVFVVVADFIGLAAGDAAVDCVGCLSCWARWNWKWFSMIISCFFAINDEINLQLAINVDNEQSMFFVIDIIHVWYH